MSVKKKPVDKIICLNRKASFNFFFEEIVESGIELVGPEVKSLRSGKATISESMQPIKRRDFFNQFIHTSIFAI